MATERNKLLSTETTDADHLIPHGESPFTHDLYVGRLLRNGQDFIGESGFLSFADAVREVRDTGRKVVLNVGDSSVAGWDTRVTVENQERRRNQQPLLSAFFRYPTFSDLLRRELASDCVVLNAGVPGHTSLNTLRRLADLLKRFRDEGIQVDFVTVYVGNNDCQWERNIEDKYSLRTSRSLPLAVDKLRARMRKPDRDRVHLRTSRQDFKNNIRAILNCCRAHGAQPVVIVPETPLYWEPGKRFVADAYPVNADMPGGKMVLAALERAKETWAAALQQQWSEEKLHALEAAREMDFVVPRIKQPYRELLEAAARDLDAPIVRTSVPRETDDGAYFVDYCHPVGAAERGDRRTPRDPHSQIPERRAAGQHQQALDACEVSGFPFHGRCCRPDKSAWQKASR